MSLSRTKPWLFSGCFAPGLIFSVWSTGSSSSSAELEPDWLDPIVDPLGIENLIRVELPVLTRCRWWKDGGRRRLSKNLRESIREADIDCLSFCCFVFVPTTTPAECPPSGKRRIEFRTCFISFFEARSDFFDFVVPLSWFFIFIYARIGDLLSQIWSFSSR